MEQADRRSIWAWYDNASFHASCTTEWLASHCALNTCYHSLSSVVTEKQSGHNVSCAGLEVSWSLVGVSQYTDGQTDGRCQYVDWRRLH